MIKDICARTVSTILAIDDEPVVIRVEAASFAESSGRRDRGRRHKAGEGLTERSKLDNMQILATIEPSKPQ